MNFHLFIFKIHHQKHILVMLMVMMIQLTLRVKTFDVISRGHQLVAVEEATQHLSMNV